MMKYTKNLESALENLQAKGAFLTVKDGENVNTMTIGWGQMGYMWKKPVFMVMVRKSRYTYNLIEKATEFTVSIPVDDSMKNELILCGTKSGRDFDKVKECGLKLEKGRTVETPLISGCKLQYECKILYKHEMDKSFLDKEIDEKVYVDNDYHVLYYGEIVDCYEL